MPTTDDLSLIELIAQVKANEAEYPGSDATLVLQRVLKRRLIKVARATVRLIRTEEAVRQATQELARLVGPETCP